MTSKTAKVQKNAKKGRPLDAARRAKFLELIRAGYSKHLAAPAAGVARTTVKQWLRSGRSANPKHPEHKRFADEYEEAEAEGTIVLYDKLVKLADTDTKAALALMRARGVPGFGPSVVQARRKEAAESKNAELSAALAELKVQAARAALEGGGAKALILGLEALLEDAALSAGTREELRQALLSGKLASLEARELG